jgi:hypothetical protein
LFDESMGDFEMPQQSAPSTSDHDRRQQPGARELLLRWARAHAYWDRAAEYWKLARSASDADVRQRFIVIAQHYRTLAKAEERSAEQAGARRGATDRLH